MTCNSIETTRNDENIQIESVDVVVLGAARMHTFSRINCQTEIEYFIQSIDRYTYDGAPISFTTCDATLEHEMSRARACARRPHQMASRE